MDGGSSSPVGILYLERLVSDVDGSEAYPTDAMAAPLRKVSLECHQTLRRVQVISGVYLQQHCDNAAAPFRVPELPSDRNTPSSHATPSSEAVTVPAEVQSDYYSPFLLFLSGRSYPPGLYTAIAHDGLLRTRIQCFWSEIDEFWWHFRHARYLLFGFLAALYYLVLLATWYTFRSATSVNFFTRWVKKAMSVRYVAMTLLPVLEKIRESALEAVGTGTEGLSTDTGSSPVRPDSEGNSVALGMPILVAHTQVGNGGTAVGIHLSERVPPTLLHHPASTTDSFSIHAGRYPPPADYHYHGSSSSITLLKARLRELEW